MWLHYEIASWLFLFAVTLTGLGMFTTLLID
jgi:hypothetical protein